MKKLFLICLLFFNLHNHRSYSQLSCKNENNKNVDWYLILKFPASYNYLYLSSESATGKWLLPNYALNNNANLVALTLNQMYDSKKNGNFYALYNDEKPKRKTINKLDKSHGGHLKGVINFDENSGYWLVHSVPKFPYVSKYDYRNGNAQNGQSFLCVSLKVMNLKTLVSQLLMMYADVYDYNFPQNYSMDSDLLNKLYKLVMNEHTPGEMSKIVELSTIQSVKLIHFGKSEALFKDLYDGLMTPQLNTSLYVESWMEGRGDKIPSSCLSVNKVYNVRKVFLDGIEYSETIDHSKWAVSLSQSVPAVCIGDINRMVSQMKRGGGSLCIFNSSIWQAFSPIVKDYEACPKYDFIL